MDYGLQHSRVVAVAAARKHLVLFILTYLCIVSSVVIVYF